jgi:diadenylate cyclase
MEPPKILELFCDICTKRRGINLYTLEAVILLAVEIAREGREGRKIGTMFVVADHENVLKLSRNMILDPLLGHAPENKHIDDPNVRETLKELAQLDGAFIVSDQGVVVSACRYIYTVSEGIELPLGLGSRHISGASISKVTKAIAVVVSESSVVRVFDNGEMIGEILPELWLLKRYGLLLSEPYVLRKKGNLAVVTKDEKPPDS